MRVFFIFFFLVHGKTFWSFHSVSEQFRCSIHLSNCVFCQSPAVDVGISHDRSVIWVVHVVIFFSLLAMAFIIHLQLFFLWSVTHPAISCFALRSVVCFMLCVIIILFIVVSFQNKPEKLTRVVTNSRTAKGSNAAQPNWRGWHLWVGE